MENKNDESFTLEQEHSKTDIGVKYARLSSKGTQEYKTLQYAAARQFIFWVFVGNVGGLVLSKFVELGPFKNKPAPKVKKYKYTTFFLTLMALSYHGYKLSRFHFIKGKKKLIQDPTNVLEEPSDY
jgi:hypothetical protein